MIGIRSKRNNRKSFRTKQIPDGRIGESISDRFYLLHLLTPNYQFVFFYFGFRVYKDTVFSGNLQILNLFSFYL